MKLSTFAKKIALGIGAMTIIGAACAQGTAEISFWVRASDRAFVEPMVKSWNDKHDAKVALTVIPNDDFVTKFGTAVAGGAAPDVVAIDLIFVPAFAKAGQLADISAEAKALPYASTLSPSHLRLGMYGNKQYSVPFSAESSFLLYNKGLFKKAGLNPDEPPKTMAEIEAAAKKITALGGGVKGFYFSGACGGCNIFTMTPYVWASGGDVLSPDGNKETLDTPALRNTLSMYRRMWKDGLMPGGVKTDNGSNFINPFFTGKIGMVGTGAFAIGLLKREHPEIDFGVTPLPGDKGGNASFAGGDSIAIPATSKHKKEAWDFIQWSLSEEVQVEQFAKGGSIPVRSDFADNKYFREDPRFIVAAKAMQAGKTPYSVYFNQLFNDPNGPWLAMIQEAVFGKGVEPAIKDAQERFKKVMSGS